MTDYNKPLPDVDDPLTAPFWAATREGVLLVQRCNSCHYLRWPPDPLCTECQTVGGEWVEVRPSGTLWSYAVYHRAMHRAFSDEIPYAVGLVELDDGPRMYGRLAGAWDTARPDQAVRAVFRAVTDQVSFVDWEPIA